MATRSHISRYLASDLLVVTIDSPTEAQVITTAAPTVQWSFAPGIQLNYRVRVYSDSLATALVYDSGVVASVSGSHQIPAGAIANGTTYYLRVDITTATGRAGQSSIRSFSTSFVPSVNVTGLTVTPLGSGCARQSGHPTMLPRARLKWTQVVPGPGETFVRYEIHRRVGGSTTWETIAHITTVSTVTYDDFTVESREVYQYSVVWYATASGFTLISNETNPPVQGYVEFEHIWLHDVADETYNVRLHSFSVREDVNQEQQYLRSWGRQRESVHIGSQQSSTFAIDISTVRATDREQFRKLKELMTRQRENASTICVRYGIPRIKAFCVLSSLNRTVGDGEQSAQVTLREIEYDEVIAAT